MNWDAILTLAIFAVAAVWAGRRLWRAWRPRPDDQAPGCGSCDGCAMGDKPTPKLHDLDSRIPDKD